MPAITLKDYSLANRLQQQWTIHCCFLRRRRRLHRPSLAETKMRTVLMKCCGAERRVGSSPSSMSLGRIIEHCPVEHIRRQRWVAVFGSLVVCRFNYEQEELGTILNHSRRGENIIVIILSSPSNLPYQLCLSWTHCHDNAPLILRLCPIKHLLNWHRNYRTKTGDCCDWNQQYRVVHKYSYWCSTIG